MDQPSSAAPLIAKIAVPILVVGAAAAYVWYRQRAANPPVPAVEERPSETDRAERSAASGDTAADPPPAAGDATTSADNGIATSPTIISGSKSGPIDLDLEIEQDEPEVPPFTFEGAPSSDPQIIAGSKSARILIPLDDKEDPAVEDAPGERPIIMGSKFGRVAIPRRRPEQADDDRDADLPDGAPPADDDPARDEAP